MSEEAYKTIGEVAKELGLTPRALRFYEIKQLVKPQRRGTTRLYSKADVERLKLFVPWLRAGLTLQEARQALSRHDKGDRLLLRLHLNDLLSSKRNQLRDQLAVIEFLLRAHD